MWIVSREKGGGGYTQRGGGYTQRGHSVLLKTNKKDKGGGGSTQRGHSVLLKQRQQQRGGGEASTQRGHSVLLKQHTKTTTNRQLHSFERWIHSNHRTMPPVATLLHGGRIESLWKRNQEVGAHRRTLCA